jgi:hypothetical protein
MMAAHHITPPDCTGRPVPKVVLLTRWWGTVGADHGGSRRHDDGRGRRRGRIATAEAEAATEGKRKQKQNETRHTHLIRPHAGVAGEHNSRAGRLWWPVGRGTSRAAAP